MDKPAPARRIRCCKWALVAWKTGFIYVIIVPICSSGRDFEKHFDLGNESLQATRENWGIIPRAIESLFDELQSINQHGAAAIIHCSYMQIYNNEVFDLLRECKPRTREPLAVREMIKGNGKHIYVSGLSEFRVTNLEETLSFLKTGNRNRTIRATEYNEKSSRSHALLQLSVEVESRGLESVTTIIRRAKLNLVDLAGSEKWDTDVSMGTDRCKELTSINQSLSALGNVISALSNRKRTHIPYRDSKLTRLLQDSLGGNTRTVVIATISPSTSALEETISTIMFADRARSVMVRVKANEMVDDAILLAQARREIARLKLLLKQNGVHQQVAGLEEQVARLTKENSVLTSENKKLRQRLEMAEKMGSGSCQNGLREPSATQEKATGIEKESSSSVVMLRPKSSANAPMSTLRLNLLPEKTISKPKVMNAFLGQEHKLDAAAQDHEQALRALQTERRELEKELERVAQLSARDAPENVSDPNEDEICPMCGLLIDDHSDRALDACIEKETHLMKQKAAAPAKASQDQRPDIVVENMVPAATVSLDNSKPRPQGPSADVLNHSPVEPAVTRRISNSADGKASPYLTRKPLTPSSSKPFVKRRSITGGRQPSMQTATNNDELASTSLRDDQESQSLGGASNQTETQSSGVPIFRQGHKSVKALKKFYSQSPYNIKPGKGVSDKKLVDGPSNGSIDSAAATGNQRSKLNTAASVMAITNSVRDIGIQLSVYTFR